MIVCMAFLVAAATAQGTVLLDNGIISPPTSGVVVSGTNMSFGGFSAFQPFIVTDFAWEIAMIGFYGYESSNSDGSGLVGTVVADIGGQPDELNPIASAAYLPPDYSNKDWTDETFNITLSQGSYWFIYTAGSADSDVSVYDGVSGEASFTRRLLDDVEFPQDPTALRIIGEVVPEPTSLSLVVLGGVALLKRRRKP